MSPTDAPRREQSALLRRMAYWGARQGPAPLLRFSPKPIGVAIGLLLGDVRARIVRNLRRIHGPRSVLRDQLDALATLANYAACFAEALAAGRDGILPRVSIAGEESLTAALARGGVVLVTAHVGPWDLMAQLLRSAVVAEVMIVMDPEPNAAAREIHDRLRGEQGVKVLHVGGHVTDALPLIAHLRKGGIAALQMDRVPPSGRVLDVQLFGQPFGVPEGPFRLAAMSGVPLVPVFARRVGFFDYEVTITEPISVPRKASADEILTAASLAVAAMESFVTENPTQWFHFVEG